MGEDFYRQQTFSSRNSGYVVYPMGGCILPRWILVCSGHNNHNIRLPDDSGSRLKPRATQQNQITMINTEIHQQCVRRSSSDVLDERRTSVRKVRSYNAPISACL